MFCDKDSFIRNDILFCKNEVYAFIQSHHMSKIWHKVNL